MLSQGGGDVLPYGCVEREFALASEAWIAADALSLDGRCDFLSVLRAPPATTPGTFVAEYRSGDLGPSACDRTKGARLEELVDIVRFMSKALAMAGWTRAAI